MVRLVGYLKFYFKATKFNINKTSLNLKNRASLTEAV